MTIVVPALRSATTPVTWAKNELWRKAVASPSLDLRFAETKSLVDATTGSNLVTFTRGTGGTYVGSDGLIKTAGVNEPRFDHDPVTGKSLGLLVEEQRINLLQRTEEFDNAIWTKSFTVATADQATAPNGALTAYRLAEDLTTNFHGISQYVAGFASGAVASLSIYAKSAGRTRFRIQTDSTGGAGTADFDLSTATATLGTGVFSSGSIQAIGDGWYRCSVRCTTSGAGVIGLKVILAATTYGTSYTGDGTSGIYLWGAQLEAGPFPSSYIKNVDAALGATRAADTASIGGSNFSSWYRQDKGTFFAQVKAQAQSVFLLADDGSFSNRKPQVGLGALGDLTPAYVTGGSVSASLPLGIPVGVLNVSTAYATNDYAAAVNGGNIVTGSGALPNAVNTLRLSSFHTGVQSMDGHLKRVTYWPVRLPNSTLVNITT